MIEHFASFFSSVLFVRARLHQDLAIWLSDPSRFALEFLKMADMTIFQSIEDWTALHVHRHVIRRARNCNLPGIHLKLLKLIKVVLGNLLSITGLYVGKTHRPLSKRMLGMIRLARQAPIVFTAR